MSIKWFDIPNDNSDKSPILFSLDAVREALLLITETHPDYDDLLGLLCGTIEEIMVASSFHLRY